MLTDGFILVEIYRFCSDVFCSDSLLFFGGLAGNLHPRVVRVLKMLKVFEFHSVESALLTQTAQS